LLVIPADGLPPLEALEANFARVAPFPNNRLWLQFTEGFDFIVHDHTDRAARLAGRVWVPPA
jgi:hypothetical protein